jgi:hypothetical protein
MFHTIFRQTWDNSMTVSPLPLSLHTLVFGLTLTIAGFIIAMLKFT